MPLISRRRGNEPADADPAPSGFLPGESDVPPMLDDLLGRTELKEQIAELEEEVHHLERERDAESERRSEAVAARQEAEETINRLEDRIADLEGKVSNEEHDGRAFRRRETLTASVATRCSTGSRASRRKQRERLPPSSRTGTTSPSRFARLSATAHRWWRGPHPVSSTRTTPAS